MRKDCFLLSPTLHFPLLFFIAACEDHPVDSGAEPVVSKILLEANPFNVLSIQNKKWEIALTTPRHYPYRTFKIDSLY